MQIKKSLRFHLIPVRMTKMKKTMGMWGEENHSSFIIGRIANLLSPLEISVVNSQEAKTNSTI